MSKQPFPHIKRYNIIRRPVNEQHGNLQRSHLGERIKFLVHNYINGKQQTESLPARHILHRSKRTLHNQTSSLRLFYCQIESDAEAAATRTPLPRTPRR